MWIIFTRLPRKVVAPLGQNQTVRRFSRKEGSTRTNTEVNDEFLDTSLSKKKNFYEHKYLINLRRLNGLKHSCIFLEIQFQEDLDKKNIRQRETIP